MFRQSRWSSFLVPCILLALSCGSKAEERECALEDSNCDGVPDDLGNAVYVDGEWIEFDFDGDGRGDGLAVDIDFDGDADGVILDTDGDGLGDAVDTDGDGTADLFSSVLGQSGNSTGGSGPTGTGGAGSGAGGSVSATGGSAPQLSSRTGVAILSGRAPYLGAFEFEQLASTANSLGRVVSRANTWESWPSEFGTVGLAVLFLNGEPFSPAQIQDLAGVMEDGGTVIVLNEWSYYEQTDNLNLLLAALGSNLRMETGGYLQQVGAATVAVETLGTHPLLAGVTAVRFAASSGVTGCDGTNLIAQTSEGICLMAAETLGSGQLIVGGDTNVLDDNGLETSTPDQNPALLTNIFASLPPVQ